MFLFMSRRLPIDLTAQQMKFSIKDLRFPLRFFLINMTKSAVSCLVTFIQEIHYGKLHSLRSVYNKRLMGILKQL